MVCVISVLKSLLYMIEIIKYLFDIDSVFFTVLTYKMSYIEFFGTIFGLTSTFLAIKANIHTWTTGIVNVLIFFGLYFQIQLYSDMLLQMFFLVMFSYGWWNWTIKGRDNNNDKHISLLSNMRRFIWITSILIATLALGFFMSNIHIYFSDTFSVAAAFPYADALTTTLSIAATILMTQKRIESWVLWIAVDILAPILYFYKGILFISMEYVVFLVMAILGLISWVNYYNINKAVER